MSNNTPTEQMIKKNPAKKVLHRLSLRYVSSTWKALEGYYQVEMNTGARVRQGSLFVMFAPPPPHPPQLVSNLKTASVGKVSLLCPLVKADKP